MEEESDIERSEEITWEESYEISAYLALPLMVFHLGSVAITSIVHRKNLPRSMVTGRKPAQGEPVAALAEITVVNYPKRRNLDKGGNRMKRGIIRFLVVVLAALSFPHAGLAEDVGFEIVETTEPFSDVVQAAEDAIINRGYTIDYHGFIGDMLERTASDVGASKKLYDDAEFFTFCSAVLSRRMMESSIEDIAYCPYVVFVYSKDDTVRVGYRKLPEGGVRDEVNNLLSQIIKDASDGF